jgi:hypothetical protein
MTAKVKMISLPILVYFIGLLQHVGETLKTYIVKFRQTEINIQAVIAVRAEIQGDLLVFLNSDGRPAASFLLKMVESMIEVSN